jgi:hypothetical protein
VCKCIAVHHEQTFSLSWKGNEWPGHGGVCSVCVQVHRKPSGKVQGLASKCAAKLPLCAGCWNRCPEASGASAPPRTSPAPLSPRPLVG